MKILRLALVLGAVAFALPLTAQEFRASPRNKLSTTLKKPADEPGIDQGSRTGGVVARVQRADNPLQLINPFAPLRYGTGERMTMSANSQGTNQSGEEERPTAWKLFSLDF